MWGRERPDLCMWTLRNVDHTKMTGLEKMRDVIVWRFGPRRGTLLKAGWKLSVKRQMQLWLRWFLRAVFVQAL